MRINLDEEAQPDVEEEQEPEPEEPQTPLEPEEEVVETPGGEPVGEDQPAPVEDEDVRVGVFICHCGVNIGGFVDVETVENYVETLSNVAHVERNMFTCAEDGLKSIKTAIKDKNLNRIIVASCTPRTHQPLFQSIVEEMGLNKYLFTFVNIREQCSWVHMKEPANATEKAKDLLRMGVARAALLEPQEEVKVDVEPIAMVLGGGAAGMTAALSLANQGFETHLIEKEDKLGGFIHNLSSLYQTGKDALEEVQPIIEKTQSHDKIKIHFKTQLSNLEGFIGNYDATITGPGGDEQYKVGSIIVATGADEYIPHGLYGYDEFENVITLTEYERMQKDGKLPDNLNNIAFIQCVGARGQDKSYCSRICCNIAIKNALKLVGADVEKITANLVKDSAESEVGQPPEKVAEPEGATDTEAAANPEETEVAKSTGGRERERRGGRERERKGRRERRERRERPARPEPGAEDEEAKGAKPAGGKDVTIFNRSITTYGVEHELLFNQAREKRVKFTRFIPDKIPKVTEDGGKLTLTYWHETLQQERSMNPDLIILSTPLVQQPDAEDLAKLLKVPLGQDKFFLEAHVKLRPVDFATDGIFLCGTAHGPADLTESISQALGAASRAAIPLIKGYVLSEAITSLVNPDLCCSCKTCEGVCPYGAIQVQSTEHGNRAEVIIAACKGCGACASVCPEGAITMRNYTDEQLISEGIAALREAI
jgi:heterodisulfide reductase subunit A